MLGDPTQAEDATHDVFLKAYRKLGEFKGRSSVRTWLYRITINHCQNLLQTWHRRHIYSTDDDSVWERAAGSAEAEGGSAERPAGRLCAGEGTPDRL